MDNIRNKIWDKAILDSEIIQETESVKRNYPRFDINFIQDGDDWRLLMGAVYWKRKELVEYILRVPGINVNHRSINGNTALHYCDNVSILKLLLSRRDLDVNIQNDWGETRLHNLCRAGYKVCVRELLLDARVNTSIRDKWKETALDVAMWCKHCHDIAKNINNSRYTTLLRIQNNLLLHDIVRMIIVEYT